MKNLCVLFCVIFSLGAVAQEYTTSDSSVIFRKIWSVRMNDAAPGDHTSNNEAAEFSPDGKLLAVGCGDATIRVVSIPEGKIVMEFKLAICLEKLSAVLSQEALFELLDIDVCEFLVNFFCFYSSNTECVRSDSCS